MWAVKPVDVRFSGFYIAHSLWLKTAGRYFVKKKSLNADFLKLNNPGAFFDAGQRMLWPVFFQSSTKAARPLSVSGWL